MLEMFQKSSVQPLVISEGRTIVTAVLAQAIINATRYAGQRKLQQPQVDKYCMMIVEDRGEFLRDQGISFGRLNGMLYLINGQHRLHAVAKSGRSVSFDFTIYECQDEADLARHYARFDSEHLSRSLKDVVANDPMVGPDFPASYLARVCEAVVFIETRFKNVGPRKIAAAAKLKERRLEAAHSWEREARLYRSFNKGVAATKSARLYGAAPLAVALVTLRYQRGLAEDFWSRTVKNDGLNIGDPGRALHESFGRVGVKWTRYQLGHLAAVAWNAEFEQRALQIVRLPKDGEIYIAGTPY